MGPGDLGRIQNGWARARPVAVPVVIGIGRPVPTRVRVGSREVVARDLVQPRPAVEINASRVPRSRERPD